jgi:hypothetical protein
MINKNPPQMIGKSADALHPPIWAVKGGFKKI